MVCLNCYKTVEPVLLDKVAYSLTDGDIYNCKCPECGYGTQVTSLQLSSNKQAKRNHQQYLEALEDGSLVDKRMEELRREKEARKRNYRYG